LNRHTHEFTIIKLEPLHHFSPFIQQFFLSYICRMRKLRNSELNRMLPEEYGQAEKWPVVLVLDNVRSMNNVGSMFRTADAFLLEKIYLCGITATPPHRDITKTAIGAEKTVPWKYCESSLQAVMDLKEQGYSIIAIEQAEKSISLMDIQYPNQKLAFVLGNEIDGVQQEIVDLSNICLEIPQFGTKHSFNVAVTCGMILWDYAKYAKG